MNDPFELVLRHAGRIVRVCTIDNDISVGRLISVDDYGNVMLDQRSTASGAHGDEHMEQTIVKRAKTEHTARTPSSLRFIRGAQIKSIELTA